MPYITANYLDVFVFPGTTFDWQFQQAPLDISGGATAQMTVKLLTPGTPPTDAVFSVTCTADWAGAVPVADLSLTVAAGTTAAWLPGLYDFQVVITLNDGTTAVIVTGSFIVKKYVVY